MTSSASCCANESMCVEKITVLPRSFSARIMFFNCAIQYGSSPFVGSSIMSKPSPPSKLCAKLRRWRIPFEKWRTFCFFTSNKPTCRSTCSCCSFATFFNEASSFNTSAAVNVCGKSTSSGI